VLFGGSPKTETEKWNSQTWLYAGGQWKKGPAAPTGLTARGGAAMAFDPDIGKMVLFGGGGPDWPLPNDTWLWDGTGWSPGPASPQGLTGRVGARMVYDDAIHKIVLFGGSGAVPYRETWLFDGAQWSRGPSPPQGMSARVFFGMTYDPVLQEVFVAGGNGGTDTWYFDGANWSPGPPIDLIGPKERFNVAYDPQLGGPTIFGGLGPGPASQELWVLMDGQWVQVPGSQQNQGWPDARLDALILWHPTEDALMLGAGVDSANRGKNAYFDAWFFREVPPQIDSVTLAPTDPDQSQAITLTTGNQSGGYGTITYTYQWYVNDTLVQGAQDKKLEPGPYRHGDKVQAKVQVTDRLGKSSDWVSSNVVTVIDRPPIVKSVDLTPAAAYVTSTMTATANGVSDPDGDQVTLHYQWLVDDSEVGGVDQPTLTPDHFTAGDTVQVIVTPVDEVGMSGAPATSVTRTIQWNLQASSDVVPGGSVGIRGGGYTPGEKVDIEADSPGSTVLATTVADANGALPYTQVPVPAPFPGGAHTFFGVGRTSGIVGRGPVKVTPVASINPKSLAAGDSTTFSGMGYVPGETVAVSFPGGAPVSATADPTGSVAVALISPPEPVDGGNVVGVAQSGMAAAPFSVISRMTIPDTAEPQQSVPIVITGFGASEKINIKFDGGPTAKTYTADATGSVISTLVLDMYFGNNHAVTATGVTSNATDTEKIDLPAFVNISPTSGPPGTKVEVTSGPGWVPGEVIHVLFGSSEVKQATADASGSIDTIFTVPNHSPGPVPVKLTESQLGLTPTATFTVT